MSSRSAETSHEVILVEAPACHLCEDAAAVLADVARDWPLTVRRVDLGSAEGRAIGGNEKGGDGMNGTVVGLDGFDGSAQALAWPLTDARLHGAHLTVVPARHQALGAASGGRDPTTLMPHDHENCEKAGSSCSTIRWTSSTPPA